MTGRPPACIICAAEGQLPVFRYHLAPAEVKEGDVLLSGESSPVRPGSVMSLRSVPLGVAIHNVELRPGRGGEIARAASASCVIQAKQDEYAIVKMPSGESRRGEEEAVRLKSCPLQPR